MYNVYSSYFRDLFCIYQKKVLYFQILFNCKYAFMSETIMTKMQMAHNQYDSPKVEGWRYCLPVCPAHLLRRVGHLCYENHSRRERISKYIVDVLWQLWKYPLSSLLSIYLSFLGKYLTLRCSVQPHFTTVLLTTWGFVTDHYAHVITTTRWNFNNNPWVRS